MSDTKEPKATIYTDRREFLLASVASQLSRWDDGTDDPKYFGLAKTEHQFKQALCDFVFPTVRKMSASDIQQAMADELASMGAAK